MTLDRLWWPWVMLDSRSNLNDLCHWSPNAGYAYSLTFDLSMLPPFAPLHAPSEPRTESAQLVSTTICGIAARSLNDEDQKWSPSSVTHLFLQLHNLKALEIGQISSLLPLLPGLVRRAFLPLLIDLFLFPRSYQSSSTKRSWHLGYDYGREDASGERSVMTGNRREGFRGTVDQDLRLRPSVDLVVIQET